MDLTHIAWFAFTAMVWLMQAPCPVAGKKRHDGFKSTRRDKSHKSQLHSTSSPESPSLLRAHTRSHSGAAPSSISDTSGGNSGQNCCLNGGLCVMGVFCHCTEKFYGFRCEHERIACGPVQHDQWARLGCHLCRCFDAEMHCLTNVYFGCENNPVEENIVASDYLDDIEIFPMDEDAPDADYDADDYYYYDDYSDLFDENYYNENNGDGRLEQNGFRKMAKHRRKGKQPRSAAMSLSPSLTLTVLSVCLLKSVEWTRSFLLAGTTSFVS